MDDVRLEMLKMWKASWETYKNDMMLFRKSMCNSRPSKSALWTTIMSTKYSTS